MRSPRLQYETALLASARRGQLLCQAYETYRALLPATTDRRGSKTRRSTRVRGPHRQAQRAAPKALCSRHLPESIGKWLKGDRNVPLVSLLFAMDRRR